MDINNFYNTFFSSDPKNITTLDMQNTFTAKFTFFPQKAQSKEKKSNGIGQKIGSAIKNAVKNLIQNSTGGLLGGDSAQDIMKLQKKATNTESSLNYITKGTMIGSGDGSLDLTPFIQSITVPNVVTTGLEDINTLLGTYTTSGLFVEPESHELNIEIVNTKLPVLETVFYPWMRETTTPFWVYDDQPYTTSNITIDMSEHVDLSYTFLGCFPVRISTYQPSMQLNSQFTRQVVMRFQYMMITSKLKSKDTINDKLKGLGKTLINSAKSLI